MLHLGHASTFLRAAARARDAGGVLVLRNEDLDEQRSRLEFYRAMIEDLRWLGIRWQEGPDVGGAYGPYSQSERQIRYLAAWRKLVPARFVYPCKCSRKELALAASAPHENEDDEPVYPGTCRAIGESEDWWVRESPAGVNWRFRVPDGDVVAFNDGHFGRRQFLAGRDFGDFLVWRRDDVPSYQLACVVDDAAMRITEVVRGADLLKSTARQVLLYRALGLEIPEWYHCPLVTDAQGERLPSGMMRCRSAGCAKRARPRKRLLRWPGCRFGFVRDLNVPNCCSGFRAACYPHPNTSYASRPRQIAALLHIWLEWPEVLDARLCAGPCASQASSRVAYPHAT